MNAAQYILISGARLYRGVISPVKTALLGPLAHCRFTPTCSQYAVESVRLHGVLAGTWLALKRIGRCHPWGGCGWDPVPSLPPARRPSASVQAAPPPTNRPDGPAASRSGHGPKTR
ncbi:MAG TPA: membrane protein insertion efficiency factor YidD [Dongiaceae bacterium]|nr:membrane protein insertion efficiency factor YidD [Dongiaceae bacterium]